MHIYLRIIYKSWYHGGYIMEVIESLQILIDIAFAWLIKYQSCLNADKCMIMLLPSSKLYKIISSSIFLHIGVLYMIKVLSLKILEVILTSNFWWEQIAATHCKMS